MPVKVVETAKDEPEIQWWQQLEDPSNCRGVGNRLSESGEEMEAVPRDGTFLEWQFLETVSADEMDVYRESDEFAQVAHLGADLTASGV